MRGITPVVELVSQAEWDACAECDGQQLEGGRPLRFANFPAVSDDGALIAVVEDRDGWGHVPSPGVRLLDRRGATARWLPVDGEGIDATTAIPAANAELAKHAWAPLVAPPPTVREIDDTESETTLAFDGYTVRFHQRSDGDVWLPPSEIHVTETSSGKLLVERRDTETAWSKPPACNLPHFDFVGANGKHGIVLFTTDLGMGGHNCDGVLQRPSWHVLAFAAGT